MASLKVLTRAGLEHYDENIKDYIDDKGLPANVRYVQCTGNHDEVAIQEALTEVGNLGGGTVYPCGTCVLSYSEEGSKTILNIPENVTIDFSNAQVTYNNVTAVKGVRIFTQKSTSMLRNCRMVYNHGEAALGEGYVPAIVSGGSVENCTFEGYMSDKSASFNACNMRNVTFMNLQIVGNGYLIQTITGMHIIEDIVISGMTCTDELTGNINFISLSVADTLDGLRVNANMNSDVKLLIKGSTSTKLSNMYSIGANYHIQTLSYINNCTIRDITVDDWVIKNVEWIKNNSFWSMKISDAATVIIPANSSDIQGNRIDITSFSDGTECNIIDPSKTGKGIVVMNNVVTGLPATATFIQDETAISAANNIVIA